MSSWAGASRRAAAGAGATGAGVALGVGELISGLVPKVGSPVVAVADVVIRRADAGVAVVANEVLGSLNKPVVLIGVIGMSLLLGAWVGMLGRSKNWVPCVAFAAFGGFGWWALASAPGGSPLWSGGAIAVAALGGWAASERLVALDAGTVRAGEDGGDELQRDRRRFLLGLIGVGSGAALSGGVGRWLRASRSVEAERAVVRQALGEREGVAPATAGVSAGAELEGDAIEGLTPYLTPTADFYRIDTSAEIPVIEPDGWTLTVGGRVAEPLTMTLDDLLAEDLVDRVVTLTCVSNPIGGDYAGTATWTGIPLSRLLERAGADPSADQIIGRSWTGWTAGFPRSVIDDGRSALVAVGMNGDALPARHGFPARLVVAGLYGYVSATKWLTEIELAGWDDFDAYWIERGWAKEGPIKMASRIDTPTAGSRLQAGRVVVAGVAWAPLGGVGAVEVWFDSVGEWLPAQLGRATSGETWVQWWIDVDLTPGPQVARVRALDTRGSVQSEVQRAPFPDGAEGYHRIRFDVVANR